MCDTIGHVRVQAARVERLVVMLNALLRRYVEGDEQGFRVRTLTLTENAHLLLFSACMLVCAHDTHAGLDRSLLADIAGLVVIEAGVRASMSVILVRGWMCCVQAWQPRTVHGITSRKYFGNFL